MFFILCYSKELDVIVHENYLNFGHSAPHITSEPGGWGGN